MADGKYFDLKIISPDRIFYEGQASMLELTTSEGEIGIYKKHIPLTALIEPGIVTITEKDGKKTAAVHTGLLEVLPDKVTILAETTEWPEEIDLHRAQKAKMRAEERLEAKDANTNIKRAEIALRRALVRIELKEKNRK